MARSLHRLIFLFNKEISLFLKCIFGIFLFILFFQPFPIEHFDFNNRLLIIAGLSGIIFLVLILIRVIFPWLIQGKEEETGPPVLLSLLSGITIVAICSVAFGFYLRYVANIELTFYIMFKATLICLSTPVILRLYNGIEKLKTQNEFLVKEMISNKQKNDPADPKKSIEFLSENNSESLRLKVSDVVFVRSADNYVEIGYRDSQGVSKKVIRNTLKNIEDQLLPYSEFIRCHRICIVNVGFIEKLDSNYNSTWLTLSGVDEKIPVSRQYLLKIKEYL